MSASNQIDTTLLNLLRCPITHSRLSQQGDWLIAETGGLKFPVRDGLAVMLLEEAQLPDGIQSIDEFKKKFAAVRPA